MPVERRESFQLRKESRHVCKGCRSDLAANRWGELVERWLTLLRLATTPAPYTIRNGIIVVPIGIVSPSGSGRDCKNEIGHQARRLRMPARWTFPGSGRPTMLSAA